MEQTQKQLKLKYKKPTVAHDLITINGKASGEIDLLFSQVTNETNDNLEANVVASVRFANLQSLENAKKLIEEAIEQIKKQEK